ncbi:biotin--[acetyl-CoA-carboxylase] ligase [Rhodoferax sp.]|uniref:biotin--[acetyl-CoA-carboxylase] ligase n=1 Tax=Rhodoferax sp. TaxID=50421 RepID=UPI002721BB93|nr:biotin--[acetyl-CoA-carboxylase] ligase [Rhodoferax sp.]MDO8319646.1 biotin--[acetyl-CoA-carboxylase] ligase [Rhodoferax sp.]
MTVPTATPIRWPAEAIWEAVAPVLPGFTVEVLPEVDSTNSELMRRARAGRPDPVLLVAEQQSAGRGRMGRQWHSGAAARGGVAKALTFSLGLNLAPADWSGLSLAVGLSVAQSLHPDIRLKWPNDLWWHDRKLAGILIETANWGETSASRYVVIGVGINLLTPDATGLSTAPVGLRELLPDVDAAQALLSIAAPLVQTVQRFESHGFAPFQKAFNTRDVLAQLPVTLSDGVQGVAQGVDATGALRLANAQGVRRITSAEVSVRVQKGPAYDHL